MPTPGPRPSAWRRPRRPGAAPSRAVLLALVVAALLPLRPPAVPAAPEAYFSPDGGVRARLLRQIDRARTSIDLAIFDFTSRELAAALVRARARGVGVRVVADPRQARGKRSEIPKLAAAGIPVHLLRGRGHGIMHEKFAVFDGRLVVTGSYNWTEAAEAQNFENALFVDDRGVVARFAARFERLFARPAVLPAAR